VEGVTYSQQSAYLRTALTVARNDPRVQMFIWFIFRDDPTSAWHSGLLNNDDTTKPAFAAFTKAARLIDFRNAKIDIKPGTSNPVVRVPVWALAVRDGVGAKLGATISVYYGRRATVAQPTSTIATDGYASFRLPINKAKPNSLYTAYLTVNDLNGNQLIRQATVVVK